MLSGDSVSISSALRTSACVAFFALKLVRIQNQNRSRQTVPTYRRHLSVLLDA